jgi:hypothetical protein
MFSPLSAAIEKRHAGSLLSKQAEAGLLVEQAQTVLNTMFGSDPAMTATAQFVKNRTLTITCSHSAVAQDIRLRMAEIVAKINTLHGSVSIDRIRYLT